MKTNTPHTQRDPRRHWRRRAFVACAAVLVALAGCRSNKEAKGFGVSGGNARGNDPLLAGPGNLLPKQNVPIPDRATGGGRPDPLVTPTGGKPGEHAGYNVDPERFKGTVILGKGNTPAALAGRISDGDELKIDDSGGVPLTPAGGTLPGGALEAPQDVEPLYGELERLGVKKEDRTLERENGKYVFRASVVRTAEGAKTQYTGVGATAREAIQQVLSQMDR